MTRRRRVPAQDAMFLWGETAETMFHVASLMPFTPPPDAGPSYLRDLTAHVRDAPVAAPWNLKLSHPHLLMHPLQSWVEDESFDIDYHVRRSALASPGDERELGVLVSRLHSHQIDFSRPPWEMHIIEGLEGGRFAIYTKVHHSLVDGFTGVKLQGRMMSTDPDQRDMPFFFSLPRPKRARREPESLTLLDRVSRPVTGVAKGVGAVVGMGNDVTRAVVKLQTERLRDPAVVDSFSAPHTILNGRTGRNRRFATQQYEMERLRALSKASGGTVNDVVMAICGGGLRAYLAELDALPAKPLVAFMPVSLREPGDEGGGNKVGATLATMGTDHADPVARLRAVIESTAKAKASMAGMSQLAALAWSGYMLAPQGPQVLSAMAGTRNPLPVAFNVCLSNVPGPREVLYLNGSRLEAIYPMSIPIHGMALNITLESYADTLNFGFIGDRDSVPHLQRLAVRTGEALAELEAAYAALGKPAKKALAKKAPAKKAAPKKAAKKTTAKRAR